MNGTATFCTSQQKTSPAIQCRLKAEVRFEVINKFHLSQNFGNQRSLRQTGPIIRAQWRVTAETEEKFKAEHLHIPPPVRGFMVIDTSFVGTGIDAEVAQD